MIHCPVCFAAKIIISIFGNKTHSYCAVSAASLKKQVDAVYLVFIYFSIQNAAYKGTDLTLFSYPKFLDDKRIITEGLYFSR